MPLLFTVGLHHCFEGLIAVDLEVLARAHYCRDMWATSGEPSWLRELGVERAHAAFPHSSGIDELQAPAPDAALYRLLRDGDPETFKICSTALTAGRSKPLPGDPNQAMPWIVVPCQEVDLRPFSSEFLCKYSANTETQF